MRCILLRRRVCAQLATVTICLGLGASSARAQAPDYFNDAAKQAQRAAVDESSRGFLVDVGPRLIEPRHDGVADFSRGRADSYVQFERALSASERSAYKLEGVIFEQAMRGHTYRASLTRSSLAKLRRDPLFRGLAPVLSVDRLSRGLYQDRVHAAARHSDGSIDAKVRFHGQVTLEHAREVLERWGVRFDSKQSFLLNHRLLVNVTHGQALALAEEDSVYRLCEVSRKAADDNIVAAALSNIDDVQAAPYSLSGNGAVIGLWEGGNPLTTHEQLTGRITVEEAAATSDHATHVSGTILGDGTGNANAMGMAPGAAMIHAYDFQGDPATEMLIAWASPGIRFANHSWGHVLGWDQQVDTGGATLFGNYGVDAHEWDVLVELTGLLVQKSSGNDGNDCDGTGTTCDGALGSDGIRYDTIGTFGNAKNILTIGAVDGTPLLTGFSSAGPTDDLRIKPDIVAKGDSLNSAWAQGVTIPGNCDGFDYCSIGGTSMSTPTTTGGVVLLAEQYGDIYGGATPSADIVKAVVVNSAIDLGRPGPDYAYGHGLLDVLAGVETILDGPARILTSAVDQGEVDTYLMLVPSGMSQLRVTGAWVDAAGVADSTDPDLVNNLDVRLIGPSGSTYFPFSGPTSSNTDPATSSGPNSVDNVESIHIDAPQAGVWTIEVEGQSVPLGPQSYALVAGSPYWLDSLPDIEVVSALTFDSACAGQGDAPQSMVFSIFNTGGGDLFIHSAQLVLGAPSFELLPQPSPPFVLLPGSHIDLTVQFHPQAAGVHLGMIELQTNDPDESVVEVSLLGLAGSPKMTATLEAKGNFGDVLSGHDSLLELQVVNQGLCNLELTSLQQLSGAAEFSVGEVMGHPSFPITVYPGEHLNLPFQYEPVDFGSDTAHFLLFSNDGKLPILDIDLVGESSPPILTTSGKLDFGTACQGDALERELQICNTGWSDLEVSQVLFNPSCSDFEIIGNPFPATVSHDFCLPLTVRYTPTGVGQHSCTLEIHSNDLVHPVTLITASGELLPISLDVPPDLEFPATVIQETYDCRSYEPFPVTNNGSCPITITAFELVQPSADYSVVNLPTLPVTLLPGETLGDGALQLCFAPLAVQRHSKAEVNVSYISNDPALGDEASVTRKLCGEATRTGLRILVTENGVPIPQVHRIDLFRVMYPDTAEQEMAYITAQGFVDLVSVPEDLPCEAFQYHQEWGGESDPMVLEPGTYRVWVQHTTADGLLQSLSITRYLDYCDFEGAFVLDF